MHNFHHSSHHSHHHSSFGSHSSSFGHTSSFGGHKSSFGSSSTSYSSGSGTTVDCAENANNVNEWRTNLFDCRDGFCSFAENMIPAVNYFTAGLVAWRMKNPTAPDSEADCCQEECFVMCIFEMNHCLGTPIYGSILQSQVRNRYGIAGNCFEDCFQSTFCRQCVAARNVRELAYHGEHPTSLFGPGCSQQSDFPDSIPWSTDPKNPANIKKPEPTEMGTENKDKETLGVKSLFARAAAATTDEEKKKETKQSREEQSNTILAAAADKKPTMKRRRLVAITEPIVDEEELEDEEVSPTLPVMNNMSRRVVHPATAQTQPSLQYPHYNTNPNTHPPNTDPANFVPMSIVFGGTGFLPSQRAQVVPATAATNKHVHFGSNPATTSAFPQH